MKLLLSLTFVAMAMALSPQIEAPTPDTPSRYGSHLGNLTDGNCAGKDCHSCIQDPSCGWCADSGKCIKGDCTEPDCGKPKPPDCEVYWKILIPCGQGTVVPDLCNLISQDNQPVSYQTENLLNAQ